MATRDERDEMLGANERSSVLDRFRLDGSSAVVTGAGQGIGRAFAHALGEAGAHVAVVDRDGERARDVASELAGKGVDGFAVEADAADPEQVVSYIQAVVDRWGSLEIAVNNAGINRNSAAEDTALDEWDAHHHLNLRGVFVGCQVAGKHMLQQGYGKIINTASMASVLVPHPQKQAAYNTSKAGVVHLTRSLAAEWADRGVRVNCISPGIIRTALIEESAALAPLVDEWLAQIPMKRLGEITDLEAAVVFLACEGSDYMTGHNLVIEGGQTLW